MPNIPGGSVSSRSIRSAGSDNQLRNWAEEPGKACLWPPIPKSSVKQGGPSEQSRTKIDLGRKPDPLSAQPPARWLNNPRAGMEPS